LAFKKILIPFLIAALCSFVLHKDRPAFTIHQKFTYFTTDNIGNAYLINGEELVKYNQSGKLFAKYSNKRYGNITCVDATNALKIILYYKDFQQLVFLDNQLSQNGEVISLENLGYEQTELVCSSFNNSFWIYNKQNNELVRFDENSQQITKTGNLKQILQADIKPNFMIEHNAYLYLNCPDAGIYVFDIYGTFNRIISLKDINMFQVNNNILYFFSKQKLCSYNPKTFEESCLRNSDSLVKNFRIEKDRWFIQYPDSVNVYLNNAK
jgi:hypothetical protein